MNGPTNPEANEPNEQSSFGNEGKKPPTLLDLVQTIPGRPKDPIAIQKIQAITATIKVDSAIMEHAIHRISEYLSNKDLYQALPESIRSDNQALMAIIENTSRFYAQIHLERDKRSNGDSSGLLAETVTVPEVTYPNGAVREEESGYRINVDYLKPIGIDPSRVLFFRLTQPSDEPKQEPYWTTDYDETVYGLRKEVLPDQRKSSVILVADLETINKNGGLIQDKNDDNGLPVRQISNVTFNQTQALATVKLTS